MGSRRRFARRYGLVICLIMAAALVPPVSTEAADGGPMPGFGVNGVVNLAFGGSAVAMADGSVVVVTGEYVLKLRPDGSFDPSFGQGGIARPVDPTTGVSLTLGVINSVVALDAERVLVSGDPMYVLRADGTLDPGFGVGGVLLPAPTAPGFHRSVLARPEGDVIGWVRAVSPPQLFRIDLTPGVTAITAWGVDMRTVVPDANSVLAVRRTPQGRLLVLVDRSPGFDGAGCSMIALDPAGNVDTTFGTSGAVEIATPQGTTPPHCHVLSVLPTGSSVVSIDRDSPGTRLAQVSAGGAVLPSPYPVLAGQTLGIASLGDGRLVLVQWADSTFRILALRPDGSEDPTFGQSLPILQPGVPPSLGLYTLVPLPNGGVLLSGDSPPGSSGQHHYFVAEIDADAGQAAEVPIAVPTSYVPVDPVRVLDTRIGVGAPIGMVPAGGTVQLRFVQNELGSPSAVALSVTAAEGTGPGFVTVFPTGTSRPTASNVNLDRVGQVAPNLVIVPLGIAGNVSLFTSNSTHLVVDVEGFFTVTSEARAGRFVSAPRPARILDTRDGTGGHSGALGVGETVRLHVSGAGGAPAAGTSGPGMSAVAVNITGTDAAGPGFVTAWRGGVARPTASNLNLEGVGSTRAVMAIVPVSANGDIDLFSQSGTHLIVDLLGWFTDDTAPLSSSGLFVPVFPTRMLDTRLGLGALGVGGVTRLYAAGTAVVPPRSAGSVLVNVTATEAAAPGYVTAYPAAAIRPTTSSLNLERAGQTIANLSIVPTPGRAMDLFSQTGTHLVVDTNGWFLA
jgi:hypothetical protein